MSTEPIYSGRYTNVNIQKLVQQLQNQKQQHQKSRITKIQRDRKTHQSCCQMMDRNKQKETPEFNNKTFNNGKLFEQKLKSVPYLFLSKHKHDNLIIPDRAFAKGKQAKRFYIKMKDTSIYSFRIPESQKMRKHLSKTQKQKTIVSRKLQQLERIINNEDGKVRTKNNKWFLLNRKTFRPPSNPSDLFSVIDPLLEPKDSQSMQLKKISLTRTFSKQNNWNKTTTQKCNNFFSATAGNSFYKSTMSVQKRTFA